MKVASQDAKGSPASGFRQDKADKTARCTRKRTLCPECSGSRIRGVPIASLAGALVGRDQETGTLVGLVAEVARGRGSSVLIEGEPGIGKSTLVRTALADPAGTACQVYWGAGDELGQALPLLPLVEGLRVREPSSNPRRHMIVRLMQGEFTADRGADISAALSEQLLALVAEQCATSPTVLVVDDLQWADPATVALWRRMARAAPTLPLLLIGMMRPVPQRDDLLALRNMPEVSTRLQLTGLADGDVDELIAALAGGRPDASLLRLAEGAAGNPLYLTELIAALGRGASLTVTSAARGSMRTGPDSLAAAMPPAGFVPSVGPLAAPGGFAVHPLCPGLQKPSRRWTRRGWRAGRTGSNSASTQ
jgi:hypothetical protein